MPQGFDKLKESIKKQDEQYGDFSPVFKLKLPNDGDTAVIRILEQGEEVFGYWYHNFSHIDKVNGWRTNFPCLDQDDEGVPCPGCREGLPRKFRGLFNVIWRNGPKFKRDDDGRAVKDKSGDLVVEGYEDQVAVWETGPEVFKTLGNKDVKYKGLASRDLEVTREGLKLDTKYQIEPADLDAGVTKLSAADKKLVESSRYDLEAVAQFVDADAANKIITNYGTDEAEDDENTKEDIKSFLKEEPFAEETESE